MFMPVRTAEAEWKGTLIEGKGRIKLGSASFEGPYDWGSRSADGPGTNPEELIGAAHAGCFTMALSAQLSNAGITPTRLHTVAKVHLIKKEAGFVISQIELEQKRKCRASRRRLFKRTLKPPRRTARCPKLWPELKFI
jgi:lipoyl-dependent peroxiredoxin